MYLKRLYIKNFKSIKELDLDFTPGKNVIVGKNNSGKSNILRAINLVLGENSPTWSKSENITENDFHLGNIGEEIFIWCELGKNTEEQQFNFEDIQDSAFAKVQIGAKDSKRDYEIQVPDFDEDVIDKIFYFTTQEGEVELNDNSNTYSKQWIGRKPYCKGQTLEKEFCGIDTCVFAFRARKVDQVIEKELAFLYKAKTSQWKIAINANQLRTAFLESAVIPSFRDPINQLRINQWSWYGKLLKCYIGNPTEELKEAFNKIEDISNSIFENLTTQLDKSSVNVAFPGTKVAFRFNHNSKPNIHKNTTVYVDDGFNSELSEKGSGIQSAVIIGLFDFYVRNIAHSGSSLLAIEEPELYLHPHGRRVIANRLNDFLNDDKNQVIITTHSTEFISTAHEKLNIIVVRKDGGQTKAKSVCFDDVKKKQILIKKQNAEMFFADAVILTEGYDKYIVEATAKEIAEEGLLDENWLDNQNISVINCGGKGEFYKYAQILQAVNIPFLIIGDFDFFSDGLSKYFTELNINEELRNQLNTLKSRNSSSVDHISNIADDKEQIQIKEFLKKLYSAINVFILPGKLEDVYKSTVVHSKKDKSTPLRILNDLIETGEHISHYVDIDSFSEALQYFANINKGEEALK